MSRSSCFSRILLALAVAAPAAIVAQQPAGGAGGVAGDERLSYSYVRTIEGRATLASYGNGPGEETDLNQILQRGDRLRVERDSRIEIVLADRNLVRVGGGSDLKLNKIAFSQDGDDRITELELGQGELFLEITEDALGDELPEIRTLTAQVLIHEPGTYRIRAESDGYTEVVVREGYAELVTERGSTIVRTNEEAWTSGDRWRPVEVGAAGARDALERWGEELSIDAQQASSGSGYVEPELSYAAAPLDDYGSWVTVDSGSYWRPRVASGWRPYYNGRWCWSPSGLTWVSAEPWGWVPYHYGTWCDLPGYGWAWRPGHVYSPAWVYWYWSDSWAGWCPVGYYTSYYHDYWNSGFRYGIYGWTGGNWGLYNQWNFCPTVRVCDRRYRGGWHSGDRVPREGGPSEPNGVLTTDTSNLPRDRWDRPDEIVRAIQRQPHDARPRELPVVTDFVARRGKLPPEVDRAVRPDVRPDVRPGTRPDARPDVRTAERRGTPLDPGGMSGDTRGERRETPPPAGWRERRDVQTTAKTGDRRVTPPSTRPADTERGGGVSTHPDRDPVVTSRGAERGAPSSGGSSTRGESRGSQPSVTPNQRANPVDDRVSSDRQAWRGGSVSSATPGSRGQQPVDVRGETSVDRNRERGDSSRSATGVIPRGSNSSSTSGGSGGSDRGRGVPAPPSSLDRGATSPPSSDRGTTAPPRRYGYPAREIHGELPPSSPPDSGASSGSSGSGYRSSPSSQPVERVIGGVRRGAPDSGSRGYGYSVPPSSGSTSRVSPGAGTAPSTRTAPSGPSTGSRGSASAPRGTTTAPGGGRGATMSSGSSHGSSGSRGSVAAAPQSGSSSSSSSSSTPPPRNGRDKRSDRD